MDNDPYTIPSSDLTAQETYSGSINVTQRTITELSATKPWVRLFAILGFLASIIYIIMGVFMMLITSFGAATAEEFNPGIEGSAGGVIIGIVYIAIGGVYFIPTFKLWGFGTAIGRLKSSASIQDLESALSYQRSFWKTLGVIFLLSIILAFVFGLAMFVYVMMSAGT